MSNEQQELHNFWTQPIWTFYYYTDEKVDSKEDDSDNEEENYKTACVEGIVLKDAFDKYDDIINLYAGPIAIFVGRNDIYCSVAYGYKTDYVSVAHKLMEKLCAYLKIPKYSMAQGDALGAYLKIPKFSMAQGDVGFVSWDVPPEKE